MAIFLSTFLKCRVISQLIIHSEEINMQDLIAVFLKIGLILKIDIQIILEKFQSDLDMTQQILLIIWESQIILLIINFLDSINLVTLLKNNLHTICREEVLEMEVASAVIEVVLVAIEVDLVVLEAIQVVLVIINFYEMIARYIFYQKAYHKYFNLRKDKYHYY